MTKQVVESVLTSQRCNYLASTTTFSHTDNTDTYLLNQNPHPTRSLHKIPLRSHLMEVKHSPCLPL